ncbi:MAG: hypothetical protein QM817_40130 [Archangium sp.]
MATKKKAVLRGVELVEAVMKSRDEELEPMPAAQLSKLKLGKRPLSPALKKWLEHDGELFTLGTPEPFVEMVEREFGEEWAEIFGELKELKDPVVLFEGWGSDSRRFLYLGKTDALGEYTVMTIDMDDTPFLCVNGPVDVWLAQQVGYLEEEEVYGHVPEAYEPARKEHAKLNFGGFVLWQDGERQRTLGDE